jgi:hypothetical protein
LKGAFGVTSGSELARRLEINQSTISSWKARGRVPRKFVQFLEDKADKVASQPVDTGGELQDRCTAVALVRFTILRRDLVSSGDVDKTLGAFRDMRFFFVIMHRALHDIRQKMRATGVDMATAQALVMHNDLRTPSERNYRNHWIMFLVLHHFGRFSAQGHQTD